MAPLKLALLVLLACALAVALAFRLARALDRRRRRVRARRAFAGEDVAAEILVAAGYEVIDRQVAGALTLRIDGAPRRFELRADFLVGRGDARYIAEVKTGERAPRLGHAATRRQLIEYLLAYPVDGVLLVDAERGEIRDVALEPPGSATAIEG